jgi:DNA-binding beta-propeller fold protein YncE
MIMRICIPGLMAALAAACGMGAPGDSFENFPDGGTGTNECWTSSECPIGWTCSAFGTCQPPSSGDGGVTPPPEVEFEFNQPASSRRFVYVAMTELDSLAKIDGTNLAVTSLAVGERPRVVVTAPGTDTAVVLDSINGTATIVRPTVSADEKTTFATLPRLNQLVIDPTGRYAVAWFDLERAIQEAGGIDFVDQIGSFQDVTILSLVPGAFGAVDLTVGFRPREVEFDDAGSHAYVITHDGVSVIDLAGVVQNGPSIVAPIPVTSDPFTDPMDLEVNVVSTGEYAVVRESGQSELRIVRLTGAGAGQMMSVPLPSAPSDVDLSSDGSRAYAVLRDSSLVAVVDVPGDGEDPAGVELIDLGGVIVGSLVLSRAGDRGLLFTNASLREELTLIDFSQPGYPVITWPLQKAVRAVAFDPTGARAIVVHAKAPGDPADATSFEEFVDRSYGYSIFDVDQGFAKLQITPVDPGALAFAPVAPVAYIILDGGDAEGAVAQVQISDLHTGVVRTVKLSSPPDAVGVLPDAQVAFVSQRHPLGRISFIDIASGQMRTITGFDLNSRIID